MSKSSKNINKKDHKVGKIMGIGVISTHSSSVLSRVEDLISDSLRNSGPRHKFYIVTPNPELVLMSVKDKRLKKSLNESTMSIPDGIGLSQAARFNSLWLPENKPSRLVVGIFQGLRVGLATFFNKSWLTGYLAPIKGRVFFLDLINLAAEKNWKVFLLGGMDNEAQVSEEKIKKMHPGIKIMSDKGPVLGSDGKPVTKIDRKIEKDSVDKINKFAPELLFVAFGNPKQEIWINENISRLNVSAAMTIGGSLRYLAGNSKLPPKWVDKWNLEWLWRLITEPKRLGRVFKAVVVFPIKCFTYRLNER